jgi:hypothetical protein
MGNNDNEIVDNKNEGKFLAISIAIMQRYNTGHIAR